MHESKVYIFLKSVSFIITGEVAEISVHPESETAFIQLQPGAVIKGQPAERERYALKIVEPYKFEDKVRRLEDELGKK